MPGHMPSGPPNTNQPGSGGPNRRTHANKSKDMIGPKIGEFQKFLKKILLKKFTKISEEGEKIGSHH